ncbi:helix-turn-helix domain-containing protein, partial [uncultured Tyzzerella sp.]|uniref:helix-turn-helix domain-containing protein n=1 Tax=uncultured Tyzzerella sp. TaxID=2321398 RepID=UPI0034DD258E
MNLSVSSLAELSNITPSYLSRFFKKEMGKGVLEFIHESRIIKAKEMMEADINIKAKEVSEIVGFSNIATFIRV